MRSLEHKVEAGASGQSGLDIEVEERDDRGGARAAASSQDFEVKKMHFDDVELDTCEERRGESRCKRVQLVVEK